MTEIQNKLFELQDKKYLDFSSSLTPNIEKENVIGVRIPIVRNLAKELNGTEEAMAFLNSLPHKYQEENILHGQIISLIKDYDKVIDLLDKFLVYVDNWAVCDTISPKVFKKNKDKLIVKIKEWIGSGDTYTIRFGVCMLMSFYLDDDFKEEYLEIVKGIESSEYYVNMMRSWYFATALAKKWSSTFPYIRDHKLDSWTNNKTIQKAIESYRITDEQKELLRTFKVK